MFKKSYNRAVLRIRIETVTPLLIRAGDAGLDPTAASLTCVRTRHAQHGSTVYIPGSSLKGVLRSTTEALVQGQTLGKTKGSCDPLEDNENCCSGKHNADKSESRQQKESAQVHREHCLACRLFGSTAMKGRASVRDLFPWDAQDPDSNHSKKNLAQANTLETRHGVSINRASGSVHNGPFDQEMVPAGVSFWGEVALENYQAWQLGLLAQAFDEVNAGFAQIGSTKSRGLGVAKIEVVAIVHEQRATANGLPVGVGLLADKAALEAYGLFPDKPLPKPSISELRGFVVRSLANGSVETQAWLAAGLAALGDLR